MEEMGKTGETLEKPEEPAHTLSYCVFYLGRPMENFFARRGWSRLIFPARAGNTGERESGLWHLNHFFSASCSNACCEPIQMTCEKRCCHMAGAFWSS